MCGERRLETGPKLVFTKELVAIINVGPFRVVMGAMEVTYPMEVMYPMGVMYPIMVSKLKWTFHGSSSR